MRKAIAVVLFAITCWAAESSQATDFQTRFLLHKQAVSEGKTTGVAGWFVVPDITTTQPLKNLFVAGPCFKDSTVWAEVMGGVMITSATIGDSTTQTCEFVGNIRIQCKNVGSFDLFTEFFVRPSDPVIIYVLSRQITTSTKLPTLTAGIELDWFVEREIRIGPRLTMSYKALSISLARQYAEYQNILRLYCLANL
ncbi:MAG: hypothetical protein V1685_06820 [Parcubacteria group bacterium]